MITYKIDKKQLTLIKENPFKLEKEIQNIVEGNLEPLLRLEFIRTEFTVDDFRIDTLAFDPENKAFVIIEYKRDKNHSVVDQGYTYLGLLLKRRADFILAYQIAKSVYLRPEDVDWSQSRVIFISPKFTTYQKAAINFKDLPIELWEIKRFANDTISFEQIIKSSSKASIQTITKNDTITKVSKEVKVYNEEDQLNKGGEEIKNLYTEIKEYLLSLDDDITIYPKKVTIGFKVGNKVFCDIEFQKRALLLFLNAKVGQLHDTEHITHDVSKVGHLGSGDYKVRLPLKEEMDMESVYSLIRQTIKINRE